jgi:hypothetical protein
MIRGFCVSWSRNETLLSHAADFSHCGVSRSDPERIAPRLDPERIAPLFRFQVDRSHI